MASGEQRRRTASFSRRRPSSQSLNPLLIPAPDPETPIWPLSDSHHDYLLEEDVVEEGRELFQNFVVEQIERESPQSLEDAQIRTPIQFKNPLWKETGRDLRMLADEFARTREREIVRQQAQGIQRDMSYQDFCLLLEELFHGEGITSERIVVLFYFCSDVAIRFLKTGVEMFHQFLGWSLSFIVNNVCSWVQHHGGWSQVLKSSFNSWTKVFVWGAMTVIFLAGVRYWRRGI